MATEAYTNMADTPRCQVINRVEAPGSSDLEQTIGGDEDIAWINRQHSALKGLANKSLTIALAVGERLAALRKKAKHGTWEKWVEDNLEFTVRTAYNYIRIHKHRSKIKSESVSDLKEACQLLANNDYGPKPIPVEPGTNVLDRALRRRIAELNASPPCPKVEETEMERANRLKSVPPLRLPVPVVEVANRKPEVPVPAAPKPQAEIIDERPKEWMNRYARAIAELKALKNEMESYDNLPKRFPQGEQGERMQGFVNALDQAIQTLQRARQP